MTGAISGPFDIQLYISENSMLNDMLDGMKGMERYYPFLLRGTPSGSTVRPRWKRKAIQEAEARRGNVTIKEYRRGLLLSIPEVLVSASRSDEGVISWDLAYRPARKYTYYQLSLPKEET